jgi:hypothetical protein
MRISRQNNSHYSKPSPRAPLPGREASPDLSGASPTLTLDGGSPEGPLTDAQLCLNCAAIASPPSANSTTKG